MADYVNRLVRGGFVLLLCLAGCSAPRYALKPVLSESQSSTTKGSLDLLSAAGNSATVSVGADVCDFLKSRYLVVVVVVSNTSNADLGLSYDSLDVLCSSPQKERLLVPLEPEALVARFSKERTSKERSRGWGTFFLALAAAHHDPGGHADLGNVSDTVSARTAAGQRQSQEDSWIIRACDKLLIRKSQVLPKTKLAGLVFFPFSKAESYSVRTQIGGENHEFLFRLRTY